jgi:hypothetical protein
VSHFHFLAESISPWIEESEGDVAWLRDSFGMARDPWPAGWAYQELIVLAGTNWLMENVKATNRATRYMPIHLTCKVANSSPRYNAQQ